MAQLIVRNIDVATVRALKVRAARHGRSAEAEHREILRAALRAAPAQSLKAHLLAIPTVGEDADFARPRQRSRRVVW
jgi:plasmid stability protein